jgi:hemerythrin-like domain-containing protein
MLIKIGASDESSDIVDLLLACHQRIRFFIDLAMRLSETTDASNEEIREAAGRVVRYFSESLPLHVADEEQSVLPRLGGREPILDRTLEAMRSEHVAHQPQLEQLLRICRDLQNTPEQLGEMRKDLADVASRLAGDFKAHLLEEESTILPAIRTLLNDQDRRMMLIELRARRSA